MTVAVPIVRHAVFALWTLCTLGSVLRVVHAQDTPDIPCDTDLGVVTAAQIRAAGYQLLNQFIPDDAELLDRAVNIIFLPVVGDVSVRFLCASCDDINIWYAERGKEFPIYHPNYCSSSSTGYDTALSFLVLEPRGANQPLPDRVKLRPFITFPPTSETASSQQFVEAFFTAPQTDSGNHTSKDISDLLATYLPSLVATSAGAIGIIPDYAGFGISTEQPTVFFQRFYEQALAVPFLYLKKIVGEQTGLCTLIDDAATVFGIGDGAQAAVHATLLLQRFDVSPLQTFLAAGPLDLNLWLTDTSADYAQLSSNSTSTKELDTWLQLTASTYGTSANAEVMVANGGSALVLDPTDPRNTSCPVINATDAGTETTLQESTIPSLCNALATLASAWPAFDGQLDRQWSTPLSACFSNNDELVSPSHYFWVEQALASMANAQPVETETQYQRYTGPTAFSTLAINETSDATHDAAMKLCSIAPLLFFTLGGFKPEAEEDRGNYVSLFLNYANSY